MQKKTGGKRKGGIHISRFGIKIKKISAGTLYEVNLGIREHFNCTDAMLDNSLFSLFLQKNGLNVLGGGKQHSQKEYTRDIICLDFDFGSRSCEDELTRLDKLLKAASDQDSRERLEQTIQRVQANKALYAEKKRSEIRDLFYNEGVNITYEAKSGDGSGRERQTLHYKMLYRTSAKAKSGQVIFINETLYDKAYDWLTMGLGDRMTRRNAKIVELSAYAPLTTSTIVGTVPVPVEDVLILKDQDSLFRTIANVVRAEPCTDEKGGEKKKCVVSLEETEVSNTLWDGMGIIESSLLPDWVAGMALLRNHLFKMCGIRGHIQTFFQDWCRQKGYDYETHQVQDMFGCRHSLKDIKVITTDNAVKWLKFTDLMGGTPQSAYAYWCERVHRDGDLFGIVKTDHPSKLGQYQQLSYQMLNTLPCTREDMGRIARTSMDYVELLKKDNDAFEQFLRKNANQVNHYEMLADLYARNHAFGNSKWFRNEKSEILKLYVRRLRKGKIFVEGDNLTVFGNPYALLLHSVGEDWHGDPTLKKEKGCIQCFTTRFPDGAYLAAFRNPHNSPNNVCYMHNVYSAELQRYFSFSQNIVAINCIETDIQDRANGMDEDSDFMLFTNHETIVECARKCYAEYPTVVNALRESGITYQNTKTDYAAMDQKFSGAGMGIGWSSNLAQLAMTYYWTEKEKKNADGERLKQLHDSFIILSVLAQIIIDGCKREYEIDGEEEIRRISRLPCMTLPQERSQCAPSGKKGSPKCDLPVFMKYTKEIKYTKNGRELPRNEIAEAKAKQKSRINPSLQCPMNWLEQWLDRIPGSSTSLTTPTLDFFLKMNGKPNNRQMTRIRSLIENYDLIVKSVYASESDEDRIADRLLKESALLLEELKKIKIRNPVTINRLIETALGLSAGSAGRKTGEVTARYTRKMLNCLYRTDRERFLQNFKSAPGENAEPNCAAEPEPIDFTGISANLQSV